MKNVPLTVASPNALGFFNDTEALMGDLYGRWQDEKEYEDINDYKVPFERAAKKWGITIVKMKKSPFGMHFTVDGRLYNYTATNRSVSYTKIRNL